MFYKKKIKSCFFNYNVCNWNNEIKNSHISVTNEDIAKSFRSNKTSDTLLCDIIGINYDITWMTYGFSALTAYTVKILFCIHSFYRWHKLHYFNIIHCLLHTVYCTLCRCLAEANHFPVNSLTQSLTFSLRFLS